MSNELYYVEFKGTPADGKGPVTESAHKGWFKMDVVSGGDAHREIGSAKVGIANQTDRNPIHISDLYLAARNCSAASYLHQMHFNADKINTITIHRLRSKDKKLVVDEEIIVENAKIKSYSNQNDTTEVVLAGFSSYQKSYYVYKPDDTVETQRVGYDLATGEEKK